MAELVGFLAEKFGYWKKTCGSYTSAQNNLLKKKGKGQEWQNQPGKLDCYPK